MAELEFSISVLIPLIGFRDIGRTIDSVILQEYSNCEVIVLRNDIDLDKIPDRLQIYEGPPDISRDIPIREVLIHQKGKGNALNIGAKKATYSLLCVLDADCILDGNAFGTAAANFADENVMAVGGRLVAASEEKNCLTFLQQIEYEKTFNISRSIFNFLHANCLISGAFGIFRKQEFSTINGYDPDTVGEDMELVLRLQKLLRPTGKRVVYDPNSICYTGTPHTFYKLLKQRDRWQRGLFDCIIKHRNMIFNPKYGLLGMIAVPYQVIIELFGPIFILSQLIILGFIVAEFEPFFKLIDFLDFLNLLKIMNSFNFAYVFGVFFCVETALTCIAEYKGRSGRLIFGTIILRACFSTLLGTVMSIPLAAARLFGMITFPWRRLEW